MLSTVVSCNTLLRLLCFSHISSPGSVESCKSPRFLHPTGNSFIYPFGHSCYAHTTVLGQDIV